MRIALVLLLALISSAKILDSYQLFTVQTVEVREKNITTTKSYYGRTAYNEANIIEITSRYEGYVEKLYAASDFQHVRKGEVLALVYSPVISAIEGELIASLKKPITKNNTLYHIAIKKLRNYNVPTQTIKKISKTRKSIDLIPIISPANGVVIKRNLFDGGAFKPLDTLFQIADLTTIAVNINIYQQDRLEVRKGQKLSLHIEGYGEINSTVSQIYPVIDPNTQTFTARSYITPPTRLFEGMFVKADLISNQKRILFLPEESVAIKGKKHLVFVAGEFEGEYEPRTIQAKKVTGGYEIISGLKPGEKVVKSALFLLDADAQLEGMY